MLSGTKPERTRYRKRDWGLRLTRYGDEERCPDDNEDDGDGDSDGDGDGDDDDVDHVHRSPRATMLVSRNGRKQKKADVISHCKSSRRSRNHRCAGCAALVVIITDGQQDTPDHRSILRLSALPARLDEVRPSPMTSMEPLLD